MELARVNVSAEKMETAERRESHRPPLPEATPWLVFLHGKDRRDQTFFNNWSILNKSHLKSIPELRRKRFVASCHGWIVLSGKDDHNYFLWNPVTLETIKLPPWEFELDIVIGICVLSSPPDDSSCTILLFVSSNPLIIFCRPGDQRWSLHNYKKDLRLLLGSEHEKGVFFMTVVAVKGKLYATLSYPKMIIIEIDQPCRLTMRSLRMKRENRPPSAFYSSTYSIESCGELLVINKGYRGGTTREEVSTITVHRLDFSQMDWVEVKSLKDQMIFLGDDCSVSCPATEPGFDGCRIYFTMEGDRSLYSFNLEENSVSVSLPCPHLPTPWTAPFWVMPDLRLTRIGAEGEQPIKNDEYNREDDKGCNEYDLNVMELEEQKEQGHFANLNLDILSLVADYLSLFDYLNFRATCRIFRTASPPLSRKTVCLRLKTTFCPWFMFLKNNGIGNFTVPILKGDTYAMNIPEMLLGTSIFNSKDGWFLTCAEDMESIFFFNPFTRETGKYPVLPNYCSPICGVGLSARPTSTECVTVAVALGLPGIRVSYICDSMQDWDHVTFTNDQPEILNPTPMSKFILRNNPVFYGDAFYLLGQHGNLGVLKFREEGIYWEVLAKPQRPCKSFRHCFLVVCDEELLSVFVGHLGNWVRVYRLSRSTMVWVEVESLPNHTLFVSNSSCFSASACKLGVANRIYFPRFRDQSILYYSLETKMYHSVGHTEPMANFYGTSEPKNCGWIEPQF